MISIYSNVAPTPNPASEGIIDQIAKTLGAKSIEAVGVQGNPAMTSALSALQTEATSLGMKSYVNNTVPLGSTDVSAAALQIKQQAVDSIYSLQVLTTTIALMTALKQEGVTIKVPLAAEGYGQQILDNPAADSATQGVIFEDYQRPVEEKTAATQAEQAALAKYEGYHGVPSTNYSLGWEAADLWIAGLKAAGANPTRASFLTATRGLKNYTANGLLAAPLQISLAGFGKNPKTLCYFFSKVSGHKFITENNGKPYCTK